MRENRLHSESLELEQFTARTLNNPCLFGRQPRCPYYVNS
jgi:hypothetical protein